MEEMNIALSKRFARQVIRRSPGSLKPERFSHRLVLIGLGILLALSLLWLKENINWQFIQVTWSVLP